MQKNTRQVKKTTRSKKSNLNFYQKLSNLLRTKALLIFALVFAAVGVMYLFQARAASITYYVSPSGSDTNPGTQLAPWKTMNKSLAALQAGDTLIVKGGTYTERVKSSTGSLHLNRGTSALPVTVKAAPGERPVIKGLLWMSYADYWTFDGINVNWDDASGSSNEHMVVIRSSNYTRITNAEIWGARSFAALLIADDTKNFTIDHNYFHDTYASNSLNQDHHIYIGGLRSGPGVIERNLFKTSPNGRGIKIGHGSGDTSPMGYATIRYNSFYDNTGPSNIQLSYGATGTRIYRNIMQKSSSHNVTHYNLAGLGNEAWENVGWESQGVVGTSAGLVDKGSNLFRNPLFTNVSAGNFLPLDETSKAYGRYAPGDTTGGGTTTPPPPPPPPSADTQAPTAPTNLRQTAVTRSSTTIAWNQSSDNVAVTGYRIYRNGSTTPLATVTGLTFTDSPLKSNRDYSYRVRAIDAAGNVSAVSNELRIRTN